MKDDAEMKDSLSTAYQEEYSGIVALFICEALMLAINDRNLLPEKEIKGVLKDAASVHENGASLDDAAEMHKQVASLINRVISGGNSVRRP